MNSQLKLIIKNKLQDITIALSESFQPLERLMLIFTTTLLQIRVSLFCFHRQWSVLMGLTWFSLFCAIFLSPRERAAWLQNNALSWFHSKWFERTTELISLQAVLEIGPFLKLFFELHCTSVRPCSILTPTFSVSNILLCFLWEYCLVPSISRWRLVTSFHTWNNV